MRPMSRCIRAHAISLVMQMPVGPLLRLDDDSLDALLYVWFDQPPNETLKDLGLIMATYSRVLDHLQALRTRRVNQCGDNRNGVAEDMGNVLEVATTRFAYQPGWCWPLPPVAKAGRNVRPRLLALPAPEPVLAIADDTFSDLRVDFCSVSGRPKLTSVVSGRWTYAGQPGQHVALSVEGDTPCVMVYASATATAATAIPLQTFLQVLAVWKFADETMQVLAEEDAEVQRQLVAARGIRASKSKYFKYRNQKSLASESNTYAPPAPPPM